MVEQIRVYLVPPHHTITLLSSPCVLKPKYGGTHEGLSSSSTQHHDFIEQV